MIQLPSYHGTSVGVLGLGPAGQATVRALTASGARVIAWDADEENRSGVPALCLPPENWPIDRLAALILCDGRRGAGAMKLVEAAARQAVPLMTDIDLFAEAIAGLPAEEKPKIVAVTGAAGKSVAVSLIHHLLADYGRDVAMGGDLGHPLMDLPHPRRGLTYVLELPVRQLSATRHFQADIVCALAISSSPDPDETEMAVRSLLRVFKQQGPSDIAVISVDDPLGQKLCTLLRSGQLSAGRMGTIIPVSGEAALSNGVFSLDGMAYAVRHQKSQVLGSYAHAPASLAPHFAQAAALALAVGQSLGLAASAMMKALSSYRGLEGRFECVGTIGKVMIVDDHRATTPDAVRLALRGPFDVLWIGGTDADGGVPQQPGRGSLRRAYLVTKDDQVPLAEGGNITRHPTVDAAVQQALADADAMLAEDPSAAPLLLFAPGIPAQAAPFEPSDFKAAVTPILDPPSPLPPEKAHATNQ